MIKFIIIGTILLFIILIIIFLASYRKKINFYIIKTNEAENSIKKALEKKKKYLNKVKPLILEEVDQNNFLDDIENFEINNNYLNNIKSLADFQEELISIIDENDKLLNNEEIEKLIEKINDNEVELNASIKYYNDNATIFNQKIESFPSNIIRLLFGYKRKEFYENKKREEFEILKEK